MERINYPGEGPNTISLYSASSISDMLSSRAETISEIRKRYRIIESFEHARMRSIHLRLFLADSLLQFRIPIPTFLVTLAEKTWRPAKRLLPNSVFGPFMTLPSIFIIIPLVRHFPEQDNYDDKITIREVTGECDLTQLPDYVFKHLPDHLRPNFPVLKSQSWASDVGIMTTYRSMGEDEYGLYYVRNRSANQKAEDEIGSFINKLIPQTIPQQ